MRKRAWKASSRSIASSDSLVFVGKPPVQLSHRTNSIGSAWHGLSDSTKIASEKTGGTQFPTLKIRLASDAPNANLRFALMRSVLLIGFSN